MAGPHDAPVFRPFQYRRLGAIVLLVLACLVFILWRLFEIQITRHQELLAKAQACSKTSRVLQARRGEIRDRNGIIVSISTPVKAIYLNPSLCSNRLEQVAQAVGALLRSPPDRLAARIRACLQEDNAGAASPRKALLVGRHVPVREWQAVSTALELESFGIRQPIHSRLEQKELVKLRHQLLFAREEQSRVYPCGESLCQVLGFVSARKNGPGMAGLYGVERGCDQVLAGKDGLCLSEQDAVGNELPACRTRYETPTDGSHVVLTIDLRIQQIVERALAAARAKCLARSASAIVLDPRTFEILALGCCPGFNPQEPGESDYQNWRNAVFTDMVEPGSVIKFIVLAGALELGLTTLDSGIYCEQGRFVVNNVSVRDHARYGLLTVQQAFAKSSNIAFSKLALALGPQQYYRYLTNFGLAQRTGVPFAAETPGRIAPPQSWSTMTLTRAAFGQGVSVSQLQMAVAMGAIANDGRLMQPYLISRIESPRGQVLRQFQPQFVRSVVSPQIARQVKEALKAVSAPGGTGAVAAMEQYTVALKTGTAQKSDAHGYRDGHHYSTVIGFIPADAPRVLISVALDEPQNGYYAAEVVAPVFRSIAEQIAACVQIPPDRGARPASGDLSVKPAPGTAPPHPSASPHVPAPAPVTGHAFARASGP